MLFSFNGETRGLVDSTDILVLILIDVLSSRKKDMFDFCTPFSMFSFDSSSWQDSKVTRNLRTITEKKRILKRPAILPAYHKLAMEEYPHVDFLSVLCLL